MGRSVRYKVCNYQPIIWFLKTRVWWVSTALPFSGLNNLKSLYENSNNFPCVLDDEKGH